VFSFILNQLIQIMA